jgi:hypothetical protein
LVWKEFKSIKFTKKKSTDSSTTEATDTV